MPRRYAKATRTPARNAKKANKRKGNRKSRIPRGINDGGQMARIKETVAFTDLDPNLGYNFNFNLSQFQRASELAPNFKFYKATRVEWTIEPLYNTFQDGLTGAEVTVPYMYMTMNRTQDQTGIQLADIQAMGAKPQKLVGKKTISYVPNWCSPGLTSYTTDGTNLTGVNQAGLQVQYRPLACPDTNPGKNLPSGFTPAAAPGQIGLNNIIYANQVVYNGHTLWVDQEVPTGTLQPVARVVCTVHWSFHGPHCTYLVDAASYKTVVPEAP